MFRPPFTILVVKEGQQPFTVRITRRLALTGFFFLFVLAGIAAYGVYWHIAKLPSSGYQPLLPETIESPAFTVEDMPAAEDNDTADAAQNSPMVSQLTVNQGENDSAEIGFEIANLAAGKQVYVWVILNPGISGSTVIFPRSPIFRGMPVDYRNGIRYVGNQPERIVTEFTQMKIGIDFDLFRVLVYDQEDMVIIDKTFSIQHTDGM